MSNIHRFPVTRRVTKCAGCGIPLTSEWVSEDPERCGECKRWKDYAEAQEAFVRGTNPDGPDAA